jgi:hypothetical protein
VERIRSIFPAEPRFGKQALHSPYTRRRHDAELAPAFASFGLGANLFADG